MPPRLPAAAGAQRLALLCSTVPAPTPHFMHMAITLINAGVHLDVAESCCASNCRKKYICVLQELRASTAVEHKHCIDRSK